jgi:tetratricopeptide (TPR) repeat protein
MGDQSKPMFQQAVSALSRAEELGFDDNPQRDALLIELKRQRALALRGSQNYEGAINQFLEILDTSPQNVKVQIDAAATLQVWGVADKRARLLAEAIKGSHKKLNPQTKREANQIWGWEYLAKAARGKNDELFCQAIYHWAECLLENGILENDANRINTALRLIETEESRPPGLNDENWKPRLQSLKQRIKQSQ